MTAVNAGPDRLSATELLARMVRIPSVNSVVSGQPHAEAAISRFLQDELTSRGFSVRTLPTPGSASGCDNLLATFEVDPSLPWLMFESHMDTVTLEGMTIEPLAATIRDGRMWGRGTCDTKGTGAAMITALSRYAASSQKPHNIAIAFTVDEEYSMTGVRALVKQWDTLGFNPVGIVVGEPTSLRPIISHNGSVRWIVRTFGQAAHSSNPSRGRSAISDMTRVIDIIESQYIPSLDRHDDLTGKAQCSVNMILGGVQFNIIPEQCEIRIDRRLVPGESAADVLPTVEKLLEPLKAVRPGLRYEQSLNFACPPLTRQHNARLVSHVRATLAALGLPDEPQGVPFCTDAGDLDEAGIPCVVLGPGDIAQAHTADEWIDLAQLDRGVDVYLALMTRPWQG